VSNVHSKLSDTTKNKNPPQWACLAEDASGGVDQRCVRVSFKNHEVLELLIDWAHHAGKKKALVE
jgi:hypothetical protein